MPKVGDSDQFVFINVPTIGSNLIQAARFATSVKPEHDTVLYFQWRPVSTL